MTITVTAPSGVGKSTFTRAFIYEGGVDARMITSTTTRAPRGTDLPLEYEYVTEEKYEKLLNEGVFLRRFGKYGNHYGTRVSYFNDATFFKSEPCVAAVLPDAVPLWRELALKGLGSRQGSILHIYLDLQDRNEHLRRLMQRGETDPERLADNAIEWKKNALESGIPYHFIDASRSPYDMVKEVVALIKQQPRS